VIEHLQDVREDALRGRVYLPAEDLERHGVAAQELTGSASRLALRRVIALEASRARALLEEGSVLVSRLSGWKRLAVAGYVAGGAAALDAIERARCDVLSGARRPSRLRRAGLTAAIALAGRAG
jgi:phytoene/squalene synthetase